MFQICADIWKNQQGHPVTQPSPFALEETDSEKEVTGSPVQVRGGSVPRLVSGLTDCGEGSRHSSLGGCGDGGLRASMRSGFSHTRSCVFFPHCA